jgi:hypothetical protein
MRFDEYWDDNDVGATPDPLPMAPDGRHTGTIADVKVKDLSFITANPKGTSLVITIAIRECQLVESIVPVNYRGKVEAICKAAGLPAPMPSEEWDEKQLIGRTVTVDTLQAVAKSGREYVQVNKWHTNPSQPLPPPRSPAARASTTKAAKAFKETAGSDDIPF